MAESQLNMTNVQGEIKKKEKIKSPEWIAFKKNKLGMTALWLLIVITLIAIAAPLIAPFDPYTQDVVNRMQGPSAEHWLGTDSYGRDTLSRIIYGSRTSLLVGVISVVLSGIVGFAAGIVAGYKGGKIDDTIMRILESIQSIPLLLLGLMVLVAAGSNLYTLILVITIGLLPSCARIARGTTIDIKEKEFVKAAISMGSSTTRILFHHIVPNITSSLLVISALHMTSAIMVEASLSFLGIGVQPPTPTWGNMIQDGFKFVTLNPTLAIYPGLALIIVSVAFNLVGDALRDALDPHNSRQRR